MDDLIAFVRAQLDEDKRRAMEAGHDTEDLWRHWIVSGDEDVMVRDANAWVAVGPYGGSVGDAAAHIARHDPASVLLDVEAKRRRLDRLADAIQQGHDDYDLAAELLPLEALPYAHRPGYEESWRPERWEADGG